MVIMSHPDKGRQPPPPFVIPLALVERSMLDLTGGKAVNLGILTAAGFNVPQGFCLTTAAYEVAVGDTVRPLLSALKTTQDRAAAARRIRDAVLGCPVPDEVREAVLEAYSGLGADMAVAVRSSATAEDLAFASFAGQQDSYLNIRGGEAVVEAVRHCWASLWNDRAVDYRARNDVDHATVRLAVVVQEMVDARAAGVLFTADPVTGTRHHSVVDAALGLGEAVVSGLVNPDRFQVDSRRRAVLQRQIGDKRMLVTAAAAGGVDHVALAAAGADPSLTDSQILDLVAVGQRIQDRLGAPQDIEWAFDGDARLWLTQSRPITTLYPLPDRTDRPGVRAYLCLTLAQGLTRPITPMGLAAFRMIGSSIAAAGGSPPQDPLQGPATFQPVGQRVFADVTPVVRSSVGRRVALAVASVMEARTAAVIRTLAADPRFDLVPGSAMHMIRRVLRVVVRLGVPRRAVTALVSPSRAYRAIAEMEKDLRRRLEMPAEATPAQRLDHVQRLLTTEVFLTMPRGVAFPLAGFVMLGVAQQALGDLARPGELQTVLRGLPHNVTTEMDLELWRLAERVRSDSSAAYVMAESSSAELSDRWRDGDLPPVLQDGLGEFLARYGHRTVAEIDLGMPRWRDDPSYLLGAVRNYLQLGPDDISPADQFAEGGRQAAAMIIELQGRMRGRSRARAVLVGFALRRVRQLAGLRETPKFLLVLALASLRDQIRLVGEALVGSGAVDEADDVYFLDMREARRGLEGQDLRSVVSLRRSEYAVELRRRHIPRMLLSDGTEPEAVVGEVAATSEGMAVAEGVLRGSPASAGSVTGVARVVLDPIGAQLVPGEILVAPSTDPGWTPLFLTAGGLVMEMGGSNSHGAVVAREYGIPAVVGVPDATVRITSGQVLTVDGAAGLVTVRTGPPETDS
jgi:phosphohistidine swiveling domain-containing protein